MQKKNFLPILALAVGHLVTDLQAGALPIVLPHLKELFTLSYSQLAAIVLTQNITSSVIQPVFGYITDKRSMPVLLPFCAAMAGAERVFEVLDEEEEKPDAPDAYEMGEIEGAMSSLSIAVAGLLTVVFA